MYFTTISNNSFSSIFPIQLVSFKEQFSQVVKQEHSQEDVKSRFIGEIRNDIIICNKLFVDTSGSKIIVEINAKLIQEDSNLLIETSLKLRKFKNGELGSDVSFVRDFSKFFGVVLPFIFVYMVISHSEPKYLFFLLVPPLGWMLGNVQLNSAKKRTLEVATEELKKEFELAYLRARNR